LRRLMDGLGLNNTTLLIDNYDSFTYNLMHCLQIGGAEVIVKRNNEKNLLEISSQVNKIVISPGPSSPENSGLSKKIVEAFKGQKPILGICLGMQIINEVFDGITIKAPYPVHGKTSAIKINPECVLFNKLPSQITVARYHSLVCDKIQSDFILTAQDHSIPMAFENKDLALYGLQFHPESFLTQYGQEMIDNFLAL